MASNDILATVQSKIWDARIPLEIRLAAAECRVYDQVDPYLIACPRLVYLPSLLPRLLAFFSPHLIAEPSSLNLETSYFVYDAIPLKWQFPLGLLYDIHVLATQRIQPDDVSSNDNIFKLTVRFSPVVTEPQKDLIPSSDRALHDAYTNSVKEADFLRSGTAKPIMSLSAADSKALWKSTQENDLTTFVKIYNSLLPPAGQLRHIPLRLYVPSSQDNDPEKGRIKVLQGQFTPTVVPSTVSTASQLRTPSAGRAQLQTLGTALHSLIPTLFPSRRAPLIARPILHGVQVPMAANLEDLARHCCYADGWLHIVIAMGG